MVQYVMSNELITKQKRGQFYTVRSDYVLDTISLPANDSRCVIEPFAGKGDLLDWLKRNHCLLPIEAYDIDPKRNDIVRRDTLMDPPEYKNCWILTNPPYLARNKCEEKEVFEKYDTNDLYKCFILSITRQEPCRGGVMIIPVGFFLSPRDIDYHCRSSFLSKYRLTSVRYFEENVFPDTSTTVVAFSFERSTQLLTRQMVEWTMMPSNQKRTFLLCEEYQWIIGGEVYHLPISMDIKIRRWIVGMVLLPDEQKTSLTIHALDTGKQDGRIKLEYKKDYTYPGKATSRSKATLCITGRMLSEEEQKKVSVRFSEWIEKKRADTWSLFLPQYRESKEYARKRIPFELVYKIVNHLILSL